MKKWLTSLFLVLALAGGVLAGTPLHSGNSRMMICCKKAKDKEQTSEASIARLCCALNCTNSMPGPSGVSFNFSPSSVIISDSIVKQIALLLEKEKSVSTVFISFERGSLPQKSPPKYIQHHSFLI
jgi:hypothetical protein